MWLKADAITGLNDGDSITTWSDSSGNSNDATQSTGSKKPVYKTSQVNSQPVIRCDGTDDILSTSTNSNLAFTSVTEFLVLKPSSATQQNYLAVSSSQNNDEAILGRDSGSGSYFMSNQITGSNFAVKLHQTTPSGFQILVGTIDTTATGVNSLVNGTASNQSTITSRTPQSLAAVNRAANICSRGTSAYASADIAEVLVYNSNLSSTNRSRVENYLRDKYNITVTSGITSATRDTSTTYNSSAGSAKLVTSSSDTGEFTQSVNVGDTNIYNLSAYARTDGSAVTSSDVQLFYNGSTVSTTYTSAGSGWYKLTGTVTGANASRVYGVQVAANKTVYVDNFSLNNYASSGTLTSSIFDSGQGSNWGTLTYTATTPTNTTVTVKARTSNDSGMSGATAFSSCNAITSATDISSNNCVTDTHRYIQYQLTLANSSTEVTPTFSDISTTFAVSDADPPSISLTALSPDPNSDNTPTLSGTATDSIGTVSNVQFQMDSTSGSWTACTASDGSFNSASEAFSCTASTLTDGSHTMYVRATDSNGNTTSSSYASDTFTIDATVPVSIELDSPGDNSYTNNERPTYRWKTTTDATAGLSKYVLEIDNPSIGSSQPSGDFTIDNIPTSGTTDITSNNKYVIHFDGFSDSDSTNNYISVYTRSTSDWGSSENDGKLREGRVSWKVKAVDNAGNESSSSRTLFVDRTSPFVEFTQVNNIVIPAQAGIQTGSPIRSGMTTNDKTPTIFGKITDPLSGADNNGQTTQSESGPKVASGPKEVNIKVEKKTGLTYTLVTLYKINMDNPYYICEPGKTIDNSKQKCDKYLPFEYTPKENLELGTYKITLTGKDKADNSSGETVLTLNITTLSQITTPQEKKIIDDETKTLKPEERKEIQENLEITKPTEQIPVSTLEKTAQNISQASKNFFDGLGTVTHNVVTGIGNGIAFVFTKTGEGIAFVFNKTGEALAFVFDKTGQGLAFIFNKTGDGLAFVGNGIGTGLNNLGQGIGNGYNSIAEHAPGITKNILLAVGNGFSSTGNFIGSTANNIGTGIHNTGVAIADGFNSGVKGTREGIANIAFAVGERTQNVSDGLGFAIVKIGYLFVNEPTKIYDVKELVLSPTSVKITWYTNHPANGKVNYGFRDGDYDFDKQTDKRTTYHEFVIENLQPNTQYHYEVMSQNKNYVYDAKRKFQTPK